MEQDLFIQAALTFEKVAAETTLPEDPNAWPNEILQELYKQVPYVADFDPHVVMDRVDAERGFAFGHIEVVNKSEIQRGADSQSMAAAGIKQCRIPIIVKNRKLQPFDILVTEDSKMLPLTEARLRQAVFRPQAFDVTSQTPGDQSMIGQLYPPYRQNYGFGGGGATMGAGMGKMGSVLAEILPTIAEQDYCAFTDKLASSELRAAYMANGHGTAPAMQVLFSYESSDEKKLASSVYGDIPSDVVQVRHTDAGYIVKRANHQFWPPLSEVWDRGQVIRAFGEKVALAADIHGSATMADGAEVDADLPEADHAELVKEFGIYKVQDEKGRHLIGYVFPNLIDTDGKALPIALFTNGSQAAVQGEIAGINVGGGASLFQGHPRGHGAFYQVLQNGRAVCTIPMTIQAPLTEGGETKLVAETYDGRQINVMVQPNIQTIVPGDEGNMLIPSTMNWLPLTDCEDVVLVSDPEGYQKTAHAKSPAFTVEIRAGGEDSYSITGLPVTKLAYDQTQFLTFDDALFLLGGLGVDPSYGSMKLAQAYGSYEPIGIRIGRAVSPASELVSGATKQASDIDALVRELRVDLVKEAAMIPDPVAVDTVLSLGFINPENLQTFVSYLPKIDETQSKLCELLVAARLGLRDLSVSALEKAIRATEEVIDGLHVLAFGSNN